jgi:ankyrin repeat protein
MVASKNNYHKITNFLSLRSEKLNQEDRSCISLLLNLVLNSNFKMATIVISRGANVDYANSEAQTALTICVKRKLLT